MSLAAAATNSKDAPHCGFGAVEHSRHLLAFCAAVTSQLENASLPSSHRISLRDDRFAESGRAAED
jgi:hypothetical protein